MYSHNSLDLFTIKAEKYFTDKYSHYLPKKQDDGYFIVEYIDGDMYEVSVVGAKCMFNDFNFYNNDDCLTMMSPYDGEKRHLLTKETKEKIDNMPLTEDLMMTYIMRNITSIINDNYLTEYKFGDNKASMHNYYHTFSIPSDDFFKYYGIIPSFKRDTYNSLIMICEIENVEKTYTLMKYFNKYEYIDKRDYTTKIASKEVPLSIKSFFKALFNCLIT